MEVHKKYRIVKVRTIGYSHIDHTQFELWPVPFSTVESCESLDELAESIYRIFEEKTRNVGEVKLEYKKPSSKPDIYLYGPYIYFYETLSKKEQQTLRDKIISLYKENNV